MPFTPNPESRPLAPGLLLRPMLPSDAPPTARLHLEHLSTGLFPRLGHRFLTRWHRTFTDSQHAWGGVVVRPGGDVVAVVLVTTDQPAHNAEVLGEHRWALARAGALGLLRHPDALVIFLRTRVLRYLRWVTRGGGPAGPATSSQEGREVVGVVHVVVTAESMRGQGLAVALLEAAEDHARGRGTTVLALVTDYPETGGDLAAPPWAWGMYDRLGWERVDVRHRHGRRVAEYRRRLTSGTADADHHRSTPG